MNIKYKIKHSILERLPEGLIFEIKKIHYLRSLKKFSETNEKDLAILKHIVKPGDHVIDIGANVGWYTKALSNLVGDKGCVYSIEPVPQTFELLSFCVKKLGLNNVLLFNNAISVKDGSLIMEVPRYQGGGDNFYQSKIVSQNKMDQTLKHYEVNTKSLDSLFSNFSKTISFIKCDVEGHELEVIRGAKQIISVFKPIWLVEISEDPEIEGSGSSEVFTIFEKEGYNAWWFDSKKIKKYCRGDRSINYFFFTDYHVSSIMREEAGIHRHFELDDHLKP